MKKETEVFRNSVSVDIDSLKKNIDSLHEEIDNQIKFYKSVSNKLRNISTERKKHAKIFFINIAFSFGIFLFVPNIYIMVSTAILSLFIIILTTKSIIIKTNDIKAQHNLLNSKELILNFSTEPFYWHQFKKSEIYKTNKIYNIYSNLGYVCRRENFILFPNFACEVGYKESVILVGKSLMNKMYHETDVVSESQSYKYKFRRIEYQQWQYQRKDGGPDRRYSNNALNSYYRYHLLHIESIALEIESRKFYDDLRNYWTFDVFRKPLKIINENKDNLQVIDKENVKPFTQITYNLSDLNSIDTYLKNKKVLYNNYGETIEFEFEDMTYIVDNKGKVKNSSKNVKDIVEAVYD